MPFLGNAFKGVQKTNDVNELVIFIHAKIIDSDSVVITQDQNVYKKFTRDPRPLAF